MAELQNVYGDSYLFPATIYQQPIVVKYFFDYWTTELVLREWIDRNITKKSIKWRQELWKVNYRSRRFRAKFVYLVNVVFGHLSKIPFEKRCPSRQFCNSFSEAPFNNVVTCCWMTRMSVHYCPFRAFFNLEIIKIHRGVLSGEKV